MNINHLLIGFKAPWSLLPRVQSPILTLARSLWHGFIKICPYFDMGLESSYNFSCLSFPRLLLLAGLTILADTYCNNTLHAFDHTREAYGLPHVAFYRYLQIQHAIQTQFGSHNFSNYPFLRSQEPGANFVHLIWTCPIFSQYWRQVEDLLSSMLSTTVPLTP